MRHCRSVLMDKVRQSSFSSKIKKNILENKLREQIKCSDGVNFDPGDEIEGKSDQKTKKTRDL